MDCTTCKEARRQLEPVPYIAHEAAMARMERTIKRLWVLLILLIVLFVGSNCAWLYYESLFADEVVTVKAVTDDGGDAIANASGEVNYNG